ncbi:hypothetical protein CHS0354_029576 [Potamilus streckersoni]|uniref:C-type lectin domain-containing protein n=1 Tax=Potamilus streckersoni TaxID=2493646 RepID=A0AAE0SEF5_9BIVA|nr:hypothetical protein CHS0354_029576 [Potamilus streckersoni]
MSTSFILSILFHQLVLRVTYVSSQSTNVCAANSVKVDDKGSPYNSVNMFFWDSSCKLVIQEEIGNAKKNICVQKNKSENAINLQNDAITTKLRTLEGKIGDVLKKAEQLKSNIGNNVCCVGYHYYQEDGFCYRFYYNCLSWSEARQVCLEDGGDLISLNDRNFIFFKDLIRSKAAACEGVWVGTTDIYTEGNWNWLNGGKVSSIFWQPKQPNNYEGNEHCGGLSMQSKYLLNDFTCSRKLSFLCQIA